MFSGPKNKKNIRAPSGLSKESKRWWHKLVLDYNITDSGGRLILLNIFQAFDRLKSAQAILKTEGMTIKDRFDQIKAHPLCAVERDARSAVLAGLRALNLDIEPIKDRGRPAGS